MSALDTDLPAGWAWAQLGDVADVQLGKMLDIKRQTGKHLMPYLRNLNVQWHEISTVDLRQMDIAPDERDRYTVQAGDLLACEGGEPGRVAVVPAAASGLAYQKALHRIRARAGMEPRYIAYVLEWLARSGRLEPYFTGSTIKHMPREKAVLLPVPVPPSAEQRRIVCALDTQLSAVDAATSDLDKLAKQLSALRRSVIAAVLRRPTTSDAGSLREAVLAERRDLKRPPADALPVAGLDAPTGWTVMSLDELTDPARKAAYGVLQPGGDVDAGVPLVRVGDIQRGVVNPTALKRIAPDIAGRYPRTTLRGGELLVTLVGTIGRTAVVPHSLAAANVARAVGVVPLTPLVNPHFVALVLQAEPFAGALVGLAHEVARKTLNLEDVRAFPVPLPDRATQDVIVAETSEILSTLDATESALQPLLRRCQALRRSILASAFAGELVETDPLDEPAELLIKGIREDRAAAAGPAVGRGRRSTVRQSRTARVRREESA